MYNVQVNGNGGPPQIFPNQASPDTGDNNIQLDLNRGESTGNLSNKDISLSPPKRSRWEAIKRFFKRRFSKITENEKQDAREVAAKINNVVRRYNQTIHWISNKYRFERKGKLDDVRVYSKLDIESFTYLVSALQKDLDRLSAIKPTVDHLNEAHTYFSYLPKRIKKVESLADFLKGRLALNTKLYELEEAIALGQQSDAWDSFEKVADAKKAVFNTFKQWIVSLKLDPSFDPATAMTKQKFHRWVYDIYPGLMPQTDRVFQALDSLENIKIKKLQTQHATLTPLLNQYRILSLSIDNLENLIHNRPINEKELEERLDKSEEKLNKTYDEIIANATLDPKEMQWLSDQAENYQECVTLQAQFEILKETVSKIPDHNKISSQLGTLIRDGKTLNQMKGIHNNRDSTPMKKIKKGAELLQKKFLKDIKNLTLDSQKNENLNIQEVLTSFAALFPLTIKKRIQLLMGLVEKNDLNIKMADIKNEERDNKAGANVPINPIVEQPPMPPAPSPINVSSKEAPIPLSPRPLPIGKKKIVKTKEVSPNVEPSLPKAPTLPIPPRPPIVKVNAAPLPPPPPIKKAKTNALPMEQVDLFEEIIHPNVKLKSTPAPEKKQPSDANSPNSALMDEIRSPKVKLKSVQPLEQNQSSPKKKQDNELVSVLETALNSMRGLISGDNVQNDLDDGWN